MAEYLQSITIGGTTYEVLGYVEKFYKTYSKSVPNNTAVYTDTYTFPNDGNHYVALGRAYAYFGTNANGWRRIDIYTKQGGSYTGGSGMVVPPPNNVRSGLTIPIQFNWNPAQGQQISLMTSHTSGTTLNVDIAIDIVVFKLGGVVRTLKRLINSICYRPLNFGKAVA